MSARGEQEFSSDLIGTAELAERLADPHLLVLDCTALLPGSGRDVRSEHDAEHIPGAIFLDMAAASAPGAPLPNTLPSAEHFAAYAGSLGIDSSDAVVVYDSAGLGSAPRMWWLLRMFGHPRVAVLDGGLAKWKREGRPLEAGAQTRTPTTYVTSKPLADVADIDDVRAAQTGRRQIVDARSRGRFNGTSAEPRAGVPSGHIAGSTNLPSTELTSPADGTLLPAGTLRSLFERAEVDPDLPTIVTCGSGVTACVLALALHQLGNRSVSVYDGSWSEWAARVPMAAAVATR